MFYQTFLSPQMKQCTIITYKHGIYKFPHELPNNFRFRTPRGMGGPLCPKKKKKKKTLRILGNQEILGKCLNFIESQPSAQPPRQNKNFASLAKKYRKIAIKPFPRCAIPHENQSQSQISCNRLQSALQCSPPQPVFSCSKLTTETL